MKYSWQADIEQFEKAQISFIIIIIYFFLQKSRFVNTLWVLICKFKSLVVFTASWTFVAVAHIIFFVLFVKGQSVMPLE